MKEVSGSVAKDLGRRGRGVIEFDYARFRIQHEGRERVGVKRDGVERDQGASSAMDHNGIGAVMAKRSQEESAK